MRFKENKPLKQHTHTHIYNPFYYKRLLDCVCHLCVRVQYASLGNIFVYRIIFFLRFKILPLVELP